MHLLPLRPILAIGVLGLIATPAVSATPPVLVWNIGTIDNSNAEFEIEGQGDEYFYLHPGNYGHLYGWDTISNTYTLPGGIALEAEPLSDPTDTAIGFERAVVGGGNEDAINIFFQLQPSHLIPGAKYRFDAAFNGVGGHDIILGFNGIEFAAPYSVANSDGYRGYSQFFTAEEVNAMIGGNVLTLRTDNPNGGTYATLDYLRITMLAPNVIFALGADDNTQADFEPEGANDAKFYVNAGDYTQVNGKTGPGAFASVPERLRDAIGNNTEGLPRALVPSRPQLDLFFQLTEEEAAAEMLRFEVDLFQIATGSSHDLRFSINGVTLGELFGVTTAQLATFDFLTSLVNPGGNVLSIEKIGGTPGTSGEWVQYDYIQLSTIPEPTSAALIGLGALGLGLVRRRRA